MVLRQCLPFSDSCFVLFQSDFLVNTSKVYLCTRSTEKTVQRGRRFTFNSSLHLPALVTEDSSYRKLQNKVRSSPRSTVKYSTCGLVVKHKLVSQSTYHPKLALFRAKPLSDKKFSGLGSKASHRTQIKLYVWSSTEVLSDGSYYGVNTLKLIKLSSVFSLNSFLWRVAISF